LTFPDIVASGALLEGTQDSTPSWLFISADLLGWLAFLAALRFVAVTLLRIIF
jgi:hypothetical protein